MGFDNFFESHAPSIWLISQVKTIEEFSKHLLCFLACIFKQCKSLFQCTNHCVNFNWIFLFTIGTCNYLCHCLSSGVCYDCNRPTFSHSRFGLRRWELRGAIQSSGCIIDCSLRNSEKECGAMISISGWKQKELMKKSWSRIYQKTSGEISSDISVWIWSEG